MVRQTSRNANMKNIRDGVYGGTTRLILSVYERSNGMTRNELSVATGLRINQVCGRVNEMIKRGFLYESRKRKCMFTNNDCYVVDVTRKGRKYLDENNL